MERLIDYLLEKYNPLSLVVYGSYSNHTNNPQSDFDALLICKSGECIHDTAVVDGVQLDAFVYSQTYLEALENYSEIIQIYGGCIVKDTNNAAAELLAKVKDYVLNFPRKSQMEKQALKVWCYKMLRRSQRADAEGLYRWHWLLVDSLQIYCDMRDMFYFGPKKTLGYLQQQDPAGYEKYSEALRSPQTLEPWLKYFLEEDNG